MLRRLRARPSIYGHIRAHLAETGLDEAGQDLPDEDEVAEAAGGLHWVPGGREGALSRHTVPEEDGTVVAEIHAALLELADGRGRRARDRVAAAFRSADPRSQVDAVLACLQAHPPRELDRLYAELRAIATESAHRDEVKFAIAILGGFGRSEDVELFRTFARHEEFTLYAAVALANCLPDAVSEWLALARHVRGWGRIELVELLLREPRADASAYLLRGGFRNEVMYGYTAHLVAERCDLAHALEHERGPELLSGARDILSTLAEDAWGGPAGGMLDYDDGLRATELYLELAEPRTLDDFVALDAIRTFVEDDLFWADRHERDELEATREAAGWTERARGVVAERCLALLGSPLWRDLAQVELEAPHEELPWQAVQVARRLEIPTRDYVRRHVERKPSDAGAWFELLRDADAEALDDALALAARLYDLDEIAAGPATELHRDGVFTVADFLLQALADHPGKGWELIGRALRSPVVRNRHAALRALSHWPLELVAGERRVAVAEAAERDPDPGVRAAAARVLAGEPFDVDCG